MSSDSNPLSRLTGPQRDCLRLVGKGYESKEIARQLGITHYAVDTRLARAVQTLGVRGRREAARLLDTRESSASERAVYASPHDAMLLVSDSLASGSDRTDGPPAPDGSADTARVLASSQATTRAFHWPIPTEGRQKNDLNFPAVLTWVGLGAIAIGLITVGLVAIALTAHEQVTRLFQS